MFVNTVTNCRETAADRAGDVTVDADVDVDADVVCSRGGESSSLCRGQARIHADRP